LHPCHFFKARSRLGIINLPLYGTDYNVGVEHGPDAVLDEGFLRSLPLSCPVHSIDYSLPEQTGKAKYRETIAHAASAFADFITGNLAPGETQVVVGGDHSVAFGSVLAVLKRFPADEIAYFHFDSHSDQSLFSDSLTGNFHGLFARVLFDPHFDDPQINALIPVKIPTANAWVFGDLEADDYDFIRSSGMKSTTSEQLSSEAKRLHEQLQRFILPFRHIHVSFDIDVFTRTLAPATGTPALIGFTRAQIMPLLTILRDHPSCSYDLVEVNPQKPGSAETISLAQDVLRTMLEVGL